MLTLSCVEVRRDLSAYHDEELSIGERIAITDHLENCPVCSVEADDLVAMRDALQDIGRTAQIACAPVMGRVQSDIVERLAAEDKVSIGTWINELLEDRRRALATTGAAIAACGLIVFGMPQLARGIIDHPDSLAALLDREAKAWAARNETPIVWPRVNAETIMPAAVMNQGEGDDSISAFAALVTSDGRLTKLEFLGEPTASPVSGVSQKQLESDLLSAAATASFQPARQDGEAVPLNVVWIVTHRTVRATVHARAEVPGHLPRGGISSLQMSGDTDGARL
jgi:hypothetical protein